MTTGQESDPSIDDPMTRPFTARTCETCTDIRR
jgi:hypothetical protein